MENTNGKVTLIIPVRKPGKSLCRCLESVLAGTVVPRIILMDCTADTDALRGLKDRYPGVTVFDMGMNPGRAHAVNTGIHITQTPYVMTLSPEIEVGKHFTQKLCAALDEDGSLFSAQGKILSADDPSRLAGAGWNLDLAGRPYVRGKGLKASSFGRRAKIMATQMDAAVYRMDHLEVTGILDERFYGRLEDLDLGFRGLLAGFENLYEPAAVCKEAQSRPSTAFYEQLETGNLVYFRYKHRLKEMKLPFVKPSPDNEAALQRGRMLCFQAEMELMEKEELGMSVTKLTLPEEFYMEIREDGPQNVYPLYLGERSQYTLSEAPDMLRLYAGMLKGTVGRLRNCSVCLKKSEI